MTINGANRVAVDAQNNSRVFNIDDGTGSPQNVSLSGMTIRGGNATSGAGLLNRENLTLTEVFFSSNTTTGDGGGIWNAGQLQLTRSALFSNGASRGGGLFQQEGTANVFESTFSGNAASTGGGIANFTGTANIHRSTISENQSGIWSQGNIALTFTNVTGSIVSGNNTEDVVRDGAFFITIASQGFNIVGNGTAISAFGQSTDQVGVNPLLSPLGFNGGPTPAYLLLPGSPAINRGNPNLPSPPVFDQRGTGFSRIIGGVVDVGAVEVNPPVVRTLAAIPNGASTQPGYNLRASEVAFYRFDLGTGVTTANGKSFVIDTFGTSLDGGSDTEIGLYGMLGNLVASDDDGAGSGGISRLSFGAGGVNGDLPAGTYFLAVCGFDTAFGASNFQATSTSSRFGNLVVNFNLAQGSIDPDFNNDGLVNGVDIDLLLANIAIGPANPGTFDLTGDGLVNIGDRDAWLAQAGNINLPSHNPYRLGDANLDGVVDGSDFNLWNSNKFTNNTAWTRGNFNADTAIDGSDFNIWNSNKFTSSLRPAPPSITTTSVPGDDRHPLRRRIGRLESHVDRVFAAYDKEDIAEVT